MSASGLEEHQVRERPLTRSDRRRALKNSRKMIGFECLDCHVIHEVGFKVRNKYRCPQCRGTCRRIRLDKLREKIERERLKK